jgi:hypothetical protein
MHKYNAHHMVRELAEHNDFFDMLVDMIPSKLYIAGQSGDDYNPNAKYLKKTATDSKEARRAQAKQAKRRKLDPTQAVGTVETKKRLAEQNEFHQNQVLPTIAVPAAAVTPRKGSVNSSSETAVVSPNVSRMDELRARLHAKLEAAKRQRPNTTATTPDAVSKRAARRAEKRRRQEEARHKAAASKSVVKSNSSSKYTVGRDANIDMDPAADLANLDFGRLAGLNSHTKEHYSKSNKALANLSKTKNLERMLADAEAKRERIEALKACKDESAQAEARQILWKDTLQEADGQRVKDDPMKLKKALKRKEVKKAKSKKAWKSRMENVSDAAQSRQKIRQHNLSARKAGGQSGANLSKKKIADAGEDGGRRLSRAGFEGRKQDFLNKGPAAKAADKPSKGKNGKQ